MRWRLLLLLLLVAALGATALFLAASPPELPERVWAHPGDPWCDRCKDGVPCFTFRRSPERTPYDPGWCFNEGEHGMQLGPPPTPLTDFVNSVEAEFRNGEHSYRGGVSYVRTGRTETVNGHRWTEYQRVRAP